MTTTLAHRVVERMTDLGGISEEEVVRRMIAQKNVAISQPAFHKIKTGKTLNPKHILALAKALDCNIEWLVRGEGAKQTITGSFAITEIGEDRAVFTQHKVSTVNTSTQDKAFPASNVSEGPTPKGIVPLISWVQAGDFCEAIDLFEVGDAEKWLPCPVNHSEQTYILRVQGSSMEPEYRDGDLIFVDPHVQANHNSDIVIRLEDANTATFKRLQIVGGEHYVSPLNKEWPEPVIRITERAHICGVVIFSGRLR